MELPRDNLILKFEGPIGLQFHGLHISTRFKSKLGHCAWAVASININRLLRSNHEKDQVSMEQSSTFKKYYFVSILPSS